MRVIISSSLYNFIVVYESNICSIRQMQARKRQKFVCIRSIKSRLRQIKRQLRERIRTLRKNINTLRRNCETLRRNFEHST